MRQGLSLEKSPIQEPKKNRGLRPITEENKADFRGLLDEEIDQVVSGKIELDAKSAKWFSVAERYAAVKELVARKLDELENYDENTAEGKEALLQLNKSLDMLGNEEKALAKTLEDHGVDPNKAGIEARVVAGEQGIAHIIKEIEEEKWI